MKNETNIEKYAPITFYFCESKDYMIPLCAIRYDLEKRGYDKDTIEEIIKELPLINLLEHKNT